MASASASSLMSKSVGKNMAGEEVSRGYLTYLLIVATGGWMLSAYDFNLQTVSLSTIGKSLHLSSTQIGLLGFFLFFAEILFSLAFGVFMDRKGRRVPWLVALGGATVMTGLTYFVNNY